MKDKQKSLYKCFTVTQPHSDDVTPYWMLVNSHRPKPLHRSNITKYYPLQTGNFYTY